MSLLSLTKIHSYIGKQPFITHRSHPVQVARRALTSMEPSFGESAPPPQEKPRAGSGDLMSSAKVVADACKAAVHHETDNLDKRKAAGAAADLVGAASEYGHLKEKGVGKYTEKAEDYLRKYEAGETKKPEGEGGGGSTDYMKVAQGFFKS